jgi:hypothetical protein
VGVILNNNILSVSLSESPNSGGAKAPSTQYLLLEVPPAYLLLTLLLHYSEVPNKRVTFSILFWNFSTFIYLQ